jgi:hypothetical protein
MAFLVLVTQEEPVLGLYAEPPVVVVEQVLRVLDLLRVVVLEE